MNVAAIAEALAACLCAQIAADGLPEPCFCGVVPGQSAAQDYMGDCSEMCGMAWVRLGAAYPSTVVGQQDISSNNCQKPLGVEFEVGIMRCMNVGDEDGNPPPPEDVLDSTRIQLQEMETMRKAIVCCPALDGLALLMGAYAPMGPLGGVVGGAWTVYVGE